LGDTTGTLTFDLIRQACEERVPERDDLDWKKQLPLTALKGESELQKRQQAELAKDIAAMANSGGGMIVFGVQEVKDAGVSVADVVCGVGLVDDTLTRQIRLVAGTNVYPPVVGLDLIALAPQDAPEDGVLVMLVPDSVDRPHIVRPKDRPEWFAAPYRHGPDTDWMVEKQIASAYAEREIGRRRRVTEFETRFQEFAASLPQTNDLRWVIALAVPDQPLHRPRELTADQANNTIEKAWSSPLRSESIGPADLTRSETTRRGVRRFVRVGRRTLTRSDHANAWARVEVHGDGAIAMAFTRDGALGANLRQPTGVPIADIESTALDFAALLQTARSQMNVTGDYMARLTVHPATQIFFRSDPSLPGQFLPWDQERVYGYTHINGPIIGTAGRDELLASWLDILTDAVHQTGATTRVSLEWLLARMSD
jgi:hypothetical protein